MATRKRVTRRTGEKESTSQDKAQTAVDNLMNAYFAGSVREVEKKLHLLDTSTVQRHRVSTGVACLDLTLGGGLTPAFHQFSGFEASGKTTAALNVIGTQVKDGRVPCVFWDAENSGASDPDYLANVMRTLGVKTDIENLFHRSENQNVSGKVYYRDDNSGEQFFNWLMGMASRLPDKRYDPSSESWWYVFPEDKKIRSRFSDVIDTKRSKEGSGLWVPATSGDLQIIVVLDSLPALVPEALEGEDPSGALAMAARMFSTHLTRIRGKLRRKRIALLGVNQLREKIGFVMGPKEYEPGGNALKFASDTRTRFTSRATGMPFNPIIEKNQIQLEKSAEFEGGNDSYRYIHIRNTKSKQGMPYLESWIRLWVEDGDGNARGFDPVFDTLHFLSVTGQLSGNKRAMQLDIGAKGSPSKSFSMMDFKHMILGDVATKRDLFKTIGLRPVDLRKGVFKQLETGAAERLRQAAKKTQTKEDD